MKPLYTYRALLDSETYYYIAFGEWGISLSKTNQRPVHCCQCASQFPVGECVWHKEYLHNCYICLPCAKTLILRYSPKGYRVDNLSNLRAVDLMPPAYTAQQVADSITRFAFTTDENGITILLHPGE